MFSLHDRQAELMSLRRGGGGPEGRRESATDERGELRAQVLQAQ